MKGNLKKAIVLLCTLVMFSSTVVIAKTATEQTAEPEYKEIWLGYNDVQPLARGDEWFQYDDGEPEYVIGWSTTPLIAQFAIRLTNDELAAYDGCTIVGAEWYHAVQNTSIPTHDYDMMIYEGNETLPLVEMVNESDSITDEGYAYHEFTEQYVIDATKDLWIVCHPYVYDAATTGDYPVGYDANEASWFEGKSSWRYRIDLGGWYEYHPAGLNGSWCLHVKIYVPTPGLEITSIAGPIGVTATIKNVGDSTATTVNWDIVFTGGFILFGGAKNGTVPEIIAGETADAKIPFVIGFGKSVIGVNVTCAEGATASKTQNATVLLIFVLPK